MGQFARTLKLSDLDLVTINGKNYHTYTYLGKINGLHKVKLVISWPAKAVFVANAMKVFLSTDIKMSGKQLLCHYTNRWPIEVFFREGSRCLGMKRCQAHSKKGVLRYQYLVMLCYIFCGLEVKGEVLSFSRQRQTYQKRIQKQQFTWWYQQAQKSVPIEELYKEFRLL